MRSNQNQLHEGSFFHSFFLYFAKCVNFSTGAFDELNYPADHGTFRIRPTDG
jgi:hypothetical protein